MITLKRNLGQKRVLDISRLMLKSFHTCVLRFAYKLRNTFALVLQILMLPLRDNL